MQFINEKKIMTHPVIPNQPSIQHYLNKTSRFFLDFVISNFSLHLVTGYIRCIKPPKQKYKTKQSTLSI